MLKEVQNVRQILGELVRRWFSSSIFDLIVWYSAEGGMHGFQLCYRESANHKALTWFKETGFSHQNIDDGEERPFRQKMAPILVPDGKFESDHILELFEKESKELELELTSAIIKTIKEYPGKKAG